MARDERGGHRNQGQERNRNGCEYPHDALHRAPESGFAESASLRRTQEGSDEITVDPFLEYVRAEGQSDDDKCEDRPIGECQADDRAFR